MKGSSGYRAVDREQGKEKKPQNLLMSKKKFFGWTKKSTKTPPPEIAGRVTKRSRHFKTNDVPKKGGRERLAALSVQGGA